VAENPNQSLWWLAAIYGFSSLLNTFQSMMLGFKVSLLGIFLLAAVFSPLWGYISISIWSWVVSLTGKWIKGVGEFKAVRAAYAWSCVPLIANIPLWFILAFLFGQQLFVNFSDSQALSQAQVALLFLILLIRIVAAIWSIVIYLNALAEVQRFTILRAISNVIIAGLLVGIAAYLILMITSATIGTSFGPRTIFELISNGSSQLTLRNL
jgi:hypothetical protein